MSAADSNAFDVRGLLENSLLEWENNIVAVAIAGGCNFRCPFCHSWRYVTGLKDIEALGTEKLFEILERQKGWIDGVIVSGGEPTLQPGLVDFVQRIKEQGVKVKLHSNGSRPEVLQTLLESGSLDCLALDYKAPLDARLFPAVGIAEDAAVLAALRQSFAVARNFAVDREYHTTLWPVVISPETLTEMAGFLERDGTWFLQQFENSDCLDPETAGVRRFSSQELDAIETLCRDAHGNIVMKRGKSA